MATVDIPDRARRRGCAGYQAEPPCAIEGPYTATLATAAMQGMPTA
jgi:hypothetical protein